MKSPLVSVIIATYRRNKTLRAALESLGKQTYGSIEVVLVDDNGHADWNNQVQQIAAEFQQAYRHIPVVHITNEANQGSAKTRNIGITAARGEYVTFLDDDDLYLPHKIENQLTSMLAAGSDYGITDLDLYNESGRLIESRKRRYLTGVSSDKLLGLHLMHHITGTDTLMFRKGYLLDIGCFDSIDFGDEFYLMKKAIESKGLLNYLPVCDVKAYVHEGEDGLSSGQGKIIGENQLYDYKKQFFSDIASKDRRYIKMRHHAVLAFANLRRRHYKAFLSDALLSFLSSPLNCVKLVLTRKR